MANIFCSDINLKPSDSPQVSPKSLLLAAPPSKLELIALDELPQIAVRGINAHSIFDDFMAALSTFKSLQFAGRSKQGEDAERTAFNNQLSVVLELTKSWQSLTDTVKSWDFIHDKVKTDLRANELTFFRCMSSEGQKLLKTAQDFKSTVTVRDTDTINDLNHGIKGIIDCVRICETQIDLLDQHNPTSRFRRELTPAPYLEYLKRELDKQQRNAEVKIGCDRALDKVLLHHTLVRRLVGELFNNALNVINRGSVNTQLRFGISIAAADSPGAFKLIVEDNCGGFPDALTAEGVLPGRPRACDLNVSSKTKGGGTGLCESAWIMSAHGGELQIKSYPDTGSEIIALFPFGAKLHRAA